MGKVHHFVRLRQNNLASIREWVRDPEYLKQLNDDPKVRKGLLRKVMINMGVTKKKALEYIDLVLGEEE